MHMVLEAKDIVASYGQTPVLRKLSARFADGRMTALIGPNGCGKSTLLKAMMGFLPISGGEVTLDGCSIARIERRALAKRIAYLPQENHCPDYMTLGELIELGGYSRFSLFGGPSERDRKLFREALEIVGLTDMAHRSVNVLSGGQKQRAWIAMVLAQDADIILMDEPVNHLDIKYQYAVLELVRDLITTHGKTVVAVLHDINLTTAFADDVIMLREGMVHAAGSVRETVTRENVAHVFDLETNIFCRDGRLICVPQMTGSPLVPA
ncbi:ABC transporter ATP-binding protein [Roseibium algae]|uniref:ABC transporter ATP-binding protein n=1 Tax=Roseibium algae TaxID=3123038 RepID=A0ABU8TIU8_9HYPH